MAKNYGRNHPETLQVASRHLTNGDTKKPAWDCHRHALPQSSAGTPSLRVMTKYITGGTGHPRLTAGACVVRGGKGGGVYECLERCAPGSDTHVHPSPAGHGHAYSGVSPVSLVVDTTL